MNTRCKLLARAAAFIVVLAALFLVPMAGQAQAVNCGSCDHFTIAVSADLHCPVTICYIVAPGTAVLCSSVSPGGSITIPCPASQAWINTCSGAHYFVPSTTAAICSPILKFSADCCGRVCNVPSADLCTRLEVQPAPCASAGCP